MSFVSLRPAVIGDEAFLIALHLATLAPVALQALGQGEDEVRRLFVEKLDLAAFEIVVENGRDVGTLRLEDHGDHLYLDLIEVAPDAQRRGVGTEVIRGAQARADARGVELRLSVLAINPARALYARLGFRVSAVIPPKIRMVWR